MQPVIEFFFHFAFAQMLMCIVFLSPLWRKNQSIFLYILLMLSGCTYLLNDMFPLLDPKSILGWISMIGGNALPGVFWLVSMSVFGDHIVLKRWQFIVASMTLVIPLSATVLQMLLGFDLTQFVALNGLVKYGAMALELVLICHALVIAIMHWRDDLVQERRYIRGGVISVSGLYIFMVIFVEQLLNIQWQVFSLLQACILTVLVTGINFLLFRLRESSLFETVKPKVDEKAVTQVQSPELMRVIDSMVSDKLYQQDGITISELAKHLSIHEYKLRHLINGELNYRNFNDFLNFYRISEVTTNLSQPELSNKPVLTLALDSGFRSLSSFNKAFKATHGVTPTEYRKKALAIS